MTLQTKRERLLQAVQHVTRPSRVPHLHGIVVFIGENPLAIAPDMGHIAPVAASGDAPRSIDYPGSRFDERV